MDATKTADNIFSNVNLKHQSQKYSTTRYGAKHATLGDVFYPGRATPVTTPSQRDNAKAGVLFKHLARKAGINCHMPEHETQLLDEVCNEDDWCGQIGGEQKDFIPGGSQVKTLIDTATSGGTEIAPIAFDSDLITFPLLQSELFPRITVVEINRGRRIEGASVSTPTGTWGTGDASNASIFNTNNMVAPIDTVIKDFAVLIEVGLNFMSDAAVDVGALLQRLIGERIRAELDKVTANGDGVNEPLGIFQASGLTVVSTDNGNTGPPTLNDYSDLMFTVGKQYRNRNMGCAFVSNDTTFSRSRQIAVGSDDNRPLLTGGDTTSFNNYMSLGWPHAVQNDLANTVAVFGALSKYRMYRRVGVSMRFETGGKELVRNNLGLLVVRARFGGQIVDTNAFAKWTDGQS